MILPPHTVTRRGRALEVRAGGVAVGMWAEDSAAGPGVFMWRPGSGWSREMVEAAASAAAAAGTALERAAEALPSRPVRGVPSVRVGACCDACRQYVDFEDDWGYCPHSPNRIAHPEGKPCVAYAGRDAVGAGAAPTPDPEEAEGDGAHVCPFPSPAPAARPGAVPKAGDFGHLQDARQLRLL